MSKREIAFFPYAPPEVTREQALRPEFIDEGDEDLDVLVNEPLPHECTPFEQMQDSRFRCIVRGKEPVHRPSRLPTL